MAQQDFDDFKQRLREWIETHPAEYDWFEAEMNRKDDAGYQMVLMQAVALVPEYQKIISSALIVAQRKIFRISSSSSQRTSWLKN